MGPLALLVDSARDGVDSGRATPEGAIEGQNDYGETGWGGPNPPDREHTYRFLLSALDTELDLGPDATKDDLYDAASGHMVGKAELTGTYPTD